MTPPVNLGNFVCRDGDPDRPLFIGAGLGGAPDVMTRAGFDAMADAFARGLLAGGIQRGERIALLAANRPEYVALLMGAMRAGVVPVPINFKFPPATVAAVIEDCGARLVVHDAPRGAMVAPAQFPGVRFASFDIEGEGGIGQWLNPGSFEPIVPRPDEPALSLYTSGSTGRPKGVLLSHASHIWVAKTRMAETDIGKERLLIAAPLYHMNALALAFLVCASGATAVLLPQFQSRAYIEAVHSYRCTWLTAVPPMIAMMLREKDALAQADLSCVLTVRMGSAPVNDTLTQQISTLLPNARIINAYGTTEGGPIVFSGHPKGLSAPSGSVGYPHPEVSVRLVGPEAPVNGVLQMKSPAVMLGYHNRPDVRSPMTEDGYYDTGDVFHRDENGFYSFVGRADDMFVSGGENIFPSEVEAVLELHPEVMQACVVPVDDDIKGTKPVAFVVRRPGACVDEETLKAHVLANAPAYQHPRHIWFLDQMLLASTNKIDRTALRQRAEAALKTCTAHASQKGGFVTPAPRVKSHDRAWVAQAIRYLEADINRSADTHLLRVELPKAPGISLYLKDESSHPTGSLKHRLARSLFLYALCNGWIGPDTTIVESSSGSTAISEAYFARLLGLRFVAVMPRKTSPEKIAAITFQGGEPYLIDGRNTSEAAIKLAAEIDGHYMDQFTFAERASDWRGNNNIAESIFAQMAREADPTPAFVVCSAGTGGTAATIGRFLRYHKHSTRLCVADPESSVFHRHYADRDVTRVEACTSVIEGIGRTLVEPSFMPDIVDRMVVVPDVASIAAARKISAVTGRLCGGSTGTNICACLELIEDMRTRGETGSIVTLLCDSGERYRSSLYHDGWLAEHGFDIAPMMSRLDEVFGSTH